MPGLDSCSTCPEGLFANASGQTACVVCSPGSWCTNENQIACSQNTYSDRPGASKQTDCTRCPERTTTDGLDGRTNILGCVCAAGYFYAPENFTRGREECIPPGQVEPTPCCVCPIGSQCDGSSTFAGGRQIALENVPISPGYFRLSSDSADIRRCPDAAVNCSGRSECEESTSGCAGGRSVDLCRPGLHGTFCRLCVEEFHFYVEATAGFSNVTSVAHCEPCANVASSRSGTILIVAISLALASVLAVWGVYRAPAWVLEGARQPWHYLTVVLGLPTKLKIVIGFYQIATRVDSIYDILLPTEVRSLLLTLRLGISFGIDGIPLACVGAAGYYARLVFWTVTPLAIVAAAVGVGAARILLATRGSATSSELLDGTAPAVLRICFLVYPIVTNIAFAAFSCFEFEECAGYLKADVAIQCGSGEHRRVMTAARIAIFLYPIGLFVLNSGLLLWARDAIVSGKPTALSRATAFLHHEYEPTAFWWELVEMSRRFLLVGAYVVGPFHPGSMMQLALATLTCVLFLAFQLQSAPYRLPADDYLAAGCSISLIVLFLTSIFYKFAMLTEVRGLRDRMSQEQREDFQLLGGPLTALTVLSVIGALILSGVTAMAQAGKHARELEQRRREAKARRLRYAKDDSVVKPSHLAEGRFHLFLSHTWAQGEEQMRVVKLRLLEMMPDVRVFLDKDNLLDGAGAEYVDVSSFVLVFGTENYFESRACARELFRAVLRGKECLLVLEPDAHRGGLRQSAIEALMTSELYASHFSKRAPASADELVHWAPKWELDGEVKIWGYSAIPTGAEIMDVLSAQRAIEWNRFSTFQDVTMRLIAERILLEQIGRSGCVFVQGEAGSQVFGQIGLTHKRRYHLYCSPSCRGASALAEEMSAELGVAIKWTSRLDELDDCEHFLLYLTRSTWTSSEASVFTDEVCEAMRLGVHLLLAHEFPSVVDEGSERGACNFNDFWNDGWTPKHLLQGEANVYKQIALTLKPLEWRKAGLASLMPGLARGGALLLAQLS